MFITGDFNIHYQKYGNGKSNILILPGWGETSGTFCEMIHYLKDYFTIYIIDYPGFGKSPFPDRDLTIDDYAVLIKEFIIANDIENPIIIAHSFGGRLTILLNTKYKMLFKKIILISPAGIKPKKTLFKKFKQLTYKSLKKIGYLLPTKTKQRYLDKLISIFGSTDFKNLNPNIRKSFINIVNTDLTKYIKYMKGDTLLMWGEFDIDTPLKDAYKMHRLIEDSGLIIIKKATHFSYLEYPEYTNKIIFEFLKPFSTKKDID